MMIDITAIVEAILGLVAVVITGIIIPYIKKKTTTEQQKQIVAWVKIAVSAAEQIYAGVGRGPEKKQYVLSWLDAHDIILDEDKIDALIEAAVYEINNTEILAIEPVEMA